MSGGLPRVSWPAAFRFTAAMLLIVLAAAILGGGLIPSPDRVMPPSAVVEPPSQTVTGTLGKASPTVEFVVRNSGGEDLALGDIETDCGCTTATLTSRRVAPGGSARLSAVVNPPPFGEREVLIRIATNAPSGAPAVARVRLIGTARPPYVAGSSGTVNFGTIDEKLPEESVVVQTMETDSPPWLLLPPSTEWIAVTGGLAEEDARTPVKGHRLRTYRFTARLLQKPPVGQFTAELAFGGRGDAASVLRLPIRGQVRPPVYSVPSALYGPSEPGGEIRFMVRSDSGGSPLEVEYPPGGDDGLDVRVVGRSERTIQFALRAGTTSPQGHPGQLILRTNHPEMPEVVIPVRLRPDASGGGSP